jgi:hypothetical protein
MREEEAAAKKMEREWRLSMGLSADSDDDLIQASTKPQYDFATHIRKRDRCHGTTFWWQISAKPSTFPVLFPLTFLKS